MLFLLSPSVVFGLANLPTDQVSRRRRILVIRALKPSFA
jgi:hypothetical protein